MSVSRGGSKQLAYDVGDQVFQSEPWMFCIMAGKVKTHCYGCLGRPDDGRGDVRRCGGCRLAGYCSETCQKADWKPRHRDECKLLKGTVSEGASKPFLLDEDDMDRLLIVLKIIAKLKRHEFGDTIGACNQKGTRTFNDLMSHESELLRQRPRLLTSYNKIKTFLDQSDTDHKICPDFLSFLRLYGRFLINNFSIYDLKHPAVVVVGRGIYLQPSVLDHSCQPNALQCSIGKTVLIKAIKPIEQKEDVRIAYMSPFDVREKRQLYLAENYFFNCGCPACTDPKVQAERNAMLCSNKDCHFPIPLDDKAGESCRKCGSENASQALAANAALDRLLAIILQIQQTTAGRQPKDPKQYIELTTAIDQGTTLLYPTNFTLALAHKEAVAMLGASTTENGLDASMESLLKTIVSRRQHIGDYSYQPCFLVVKWLVDKDRDREAMALVSQVAEFFKTVAGETSVFYKAWCSHLSNL